MAQFIAYKNANQNTQNAFPYLVDIQSNLLSALQTTVVIPLCGMASFGEKPISRLCPVVVLEDRQYLALAQQLAGIDKKQLGAKVADLSGYRDDLLAAVDFITSGV